MCDCCHRWRHLIDEEGAGHPEDVAEEQLLVQHLHARDEN